MSKYEVFKNAPITEALLDIQVALSPETQAEDLAALQEGIDERFPVRQERSFLAFQIEPRLGSKPEYTERSGGLQGYIFFSSESDPSKAVQSRLDGFAFSKLKPYEDWSTFRDEARELWQRYVEIAHPTTVKRLALRFINRIALPHPVHDFDEYFRTIPEIPETLPYHVADFFMRLVIPQPNSQTAAIITVATSAAEPDEETVPVIFDIDVFVESEFDPHSDAIWTLFEELRDIKNKYFFDSLTDKTKELFR